MADAAAAGRFSLVGGTRGQSVVSDDAAVQAETEGPLGGSGGAGEGGATRTVAGRGRRDAGAGRFNRRAAADAPAPCGGAAGDSGGASAGLQCGGRNAGGILQYLP